MSTLTYYFEGKNHHLTEAERRPFENDNSYNRVDANSVTVFNMKDGSQIIGKALEIEVIRPVNGFDNPLQARFIIEEENGNHVTINFGEIESHNPPPFKKTQFFQNTPPNN